MKIAYIACISQDNLGVQKKIQRQIEHWRRAGHEVQCFFMAPHDSKPPPRYSLWKRCNLLNPTLALLLSVRAYQPDCIYMREDTLPVSRFLRFLFWRKKIILEINSNYDTEGRLDYASSFKAKRNFWINYAINHFFYHRIAGIVSVSHELLQLPHFLRCKEKIVIPNTIDIDSVTIQKCHNATLPVGLIFLGSPNQPWHGVDKIIQLARNLGDDFLIHLVGPQEKDIAVFNPPSNVIAHGYRTDYTDILRKCHIAIGTLALHRNNMKEASPLKVREYLAGGLPVIIAYDDSAFISLAQLPDFILRLKNSEDCIKEHDTIEKIRQFCLKNCTRVVSHNDIREFIDSRYFEEKRLAFIRNRVQ